MSKLKKSGHVRNNAFKIPEVSPSNSYTLKLFFTNLKALAPITNSSVLRNS